MAAAVSSGRGAGMAGMATIPACSGRSAVPMHVKRRVPAMFFFSAPLAAFAVAPTPAVSARHRRAQIGDFKQGIAQIKGEECAVPGERGHRHVHAAYACNALKMRH